jgi:hypothetical protein
MEMNEQTTARHASFKSENERLMTDRCAAELFNAANEKLVGGLFWKSLMQLIEILTTVRRQWHGSNRIASLQLIYSMFYRIF